VTTERPIVIATPLALVEQLRVGLGKAVQAIDQLALQRGEYARYHHIDQQVTQVYRLANQRVSPAAKVSRVFFIWSLGNPIDGLTKCR
jgi:hypothetical protein